MLVFETKFRKYLNEFYEILSTNENDWTVKGFIDIAKNIYTISVDTKVISKIMELMLFPAIQKFAVQNNYKMVLSSEQNHYPDITFIDSEDNKIALDLKSTYRKNDKIVSGFTLGAFTGYFRYRKSNKNITFPYEKYSKHYILGIIYSKRNKEINEKEKYTINELEEITSVIYDFEFIFQEKYKIAKDRPGSGNTKNIGSVTNIEDLKNGTGTFSKLGVKIFDDYWINYLTKDMAKKIDLPKPPYNNIEKYMKFRNIEEIK